MSKRATAGKILFLATENIQGPFDVSYDELSDIERAAWESEAVRIILKDITDIEMSAAIDKVEIND